MNINHTYYDIALSMLKTNLTLPIFNSLGIQTNSTLSPQLSQMVYPASCYSCSTSQCMWQDPKSPTPSPLSDAISYSSMAFLVLSLVFYWPLLYKFRDRPSIRRRLIIPYFNPACQLVVVLFQLFEISKPCYLLQQLIIYFFSAYQVVVYYVIMSRFSVLRKLYWILKKVKSEREIAAFKILVSRSFGVTSALILGFVVSVVITCAPVAAYREQFYGYNSQFTTALAITIISLVPAGVSLIVVASNMILNFPLIKTKGLAYFLFFDGTFF